MSNQEILAKIAEATQELSTADSYIVALISEQEFMEAPICPHCGSDEGTACLEEVMDLSNHMAEMHLCKDCAGVFIVTGYPTLFETAAPVFLQVNMKDGENPIAEVVASDMAKSIMAQVEVGD